MQPWTTLLPGFCSHFEPASILNCQYVHCQYIQHFFLPTETETGMLQLQYTRERGRKNIYSRIEEPFQFI